MTARTLVATDLDRTMIYSRAAAGERFDTSAPVCVEVYDDAPLSYMSGTAHTLLADLADRAVVVPATTQTVTLPVEMLTR